MSAKFTIAKYLRLSSEDDDLKTSGKAESNSIVNQRNLLDAFIGGVSDFAGANILEFVDDGWSGRNFERPGVQDLLERARRGDIQCVIVKDISRFGRNYQEVGNYISRIFPFLGVRFISVNDGLDSANPMETDSLDAAFRTLMYDLYSKSLSRTIRKARAFRAGRGDFIAPFAPYGYVKDPENHHRLLIDPEAAEVVRMIFRMAGDGKSAPEIARELNLRKILTPRLYKKAAGCSRTVWPCVNEKESVWGRSTIYKILHDETYLGKSVFGRLKPSEAASRRHVRVDREDWIVVENTHEAIVSQEEFNRVRKPRSSPAPCAADKTFERPFAGKVFCGVCGRAMRRGNVSKPYYCCETRKITDAYDCPAEKTLESDLTALVHQALLMEARTAVDMERLWISRHGTKRKDAAETLRALSALKETYAKLEGNADRLYESLIEGEITKAEYAAEKAAAAKEMECVSSEIAALQAELDNAGQDGALRNRFVDGFKKYADIEEITREAMTELLDRIKIYPDKRVEIVWKFADDYERLVLSLTGG